MLLYITSNIEDIKFESKEQRYKTIRSQLLKEKVIKT